MLGELGEMRRRLQALHAEAEGLRVGLRTLVDTRVHFTRARATDAWPLADCEQASAPLRQRLAPPAVLLAWPLSVGQR